MNDALVHMPEISNVLPEHDWIFEVTSLDPSTISYLREPEGGSWADCVQVMHRALFEWHNKIEDRPEPDFDTMRAIRDALTDLEELTIPERTLRFDLGGNRWLIRRCRRYLTVRDLFYSLANVADPDDPVSVYLGVVNTGTADKPVEYVIEDYYWVSGVTRSDNGPGNGVFHVELDTATAADPREI